MAPTGQLAAQVPHSTQALASMTYLLSPAEMASAGQLAAQVPHMTQSSEITYALVSTSYIFRQWIVADKMHCTINHQKINAQFKILAGFRD